VSIQGQYFDAQQSRRRVAELRKADDGRMTLCVGDVEQDVALQALHVSARIGNIPRKLTFPDGAVFETPDNDAIDALLPAHQQGSAWVHRLEQRWRIALGALAAIAVFTALFLRFGIPWTAHRVADLLPPRIDAAIGAQTLQILDNGLLKPSTLPAARQAQLRQLFARVTGDRADGHVYRLELRDSKTLGPNAIALPAGIVIMTDQLVALSQHDEELAAVLAHEVGHVRGRHALRQLLQSAGISAMAVVLLGDMTSLSALTGAVPLLLQARNSRDFEREADAYSRRWLDAEGIPARRFDDILCRLSAKHGESGSGFAYLSTHPATTERARCT